MTCSVCSAAMPEGGRFCPVCGADMTAPAAERRPFDTVSSVSKMLAGAVAGHYRIGKLLGRGGMGTVFLAEDLSLQREVAIKVLPPRLTAEAKFVSRFLQEARTAAKLDHPNIIPIYEVQSADGLHYFAMKYVQGHTVEELLADGPLPVGECRRILVDAALALGHAHRRGVVHRDVKPSNIMVDETGRVLLTDFGIAKALESSTLVTFTDQIVGTPHYMSPEQAKGGVRLDGRSDQYSLAVVGFQILTGKLLYPADQAHTVMYDHIHEPPPSPRTARPDTPAYLEQALLKALSKEPGERFARMEDFAAAVAPERAPALLAGSFDSGASGARWRLPARPAVGGIVVIGVLAAGWLWLAKRPTPDAAVPLTTTPQRESIVTRTDAGTTTAAPSPHPPSRAPAGPSPAASHGPTTPSAPRPAGAAATGYVTVDASPYGKVSIDGVDVGDTPLLNHALAPGTYTVRVTRDGYVSATWTVTVTAGNVERRRFVLVPQ